MAEKNKERMAGVLIPVFSMRRTGDMGIGDTTAVMQCLEWLANFDVKFLQLLPINVTGKDRSPYSALSSVALEPLYLDVEKVEGVSAECMEQARKMLTASAKVDYVAVSAAKEYVLRAAYQQNPQLKQLEEFKDEQRDWLEPYVKYRWLMDQAGGEEDWFCWPDAFSTAQKAAIYEEQCRLTHGIAVQHEQDYYAWQQMHAFRQWDNVRKRSDVLGVNLMGDIPIGVNSASADVFFEHEWFDLDWYGGAPPETEFATNVFTRKWGQNWGVPLYVWAKHEQSDFRWWRRRVEKLAAVFQMFRVDHILGFYRIYAFPWHPRENERFLNMSEEEAARATGGRLPAFAPRADDTVVHKAQNLQSGDRYLQAVIEAAGDAVIVGEDLGCVPDYVRPHLREIGVAGFRICHWEMDEKGKVCAPESHDECAFAAYSTHDMEPIKSLWEIARNAKKEERIESRRILRKLCAFAGIDQPKGGGTFPEYSTEIKRALVAALLRSKARYAALLINEVIDDAERINLPGTVGSHNWTYRIPWAFQDEPSNVLQEWVALQAAIRTSGRGEEVAR